MDKLIRLVDTLIKANQNKPIKRLLINDFEYHTDNGEITIIINDVEIEFTE